MLAAKEHSSPDAEWVEGAGAHRVPPILLAGLLAGGLAVVIIVGNARGDVHRTAYGDGLIYRYLATHLDTRTDELHEVVVERGPSLRFGRVGLPVLIWVLAAGQEAAVPWAHVAAMVLSAAAAGSAAAALFPRAGPMAGVLPFLAPGFTLSLSGGYAEALALPLGLWAIWAALRSRWVLSTAALAGAILTKENAVFILAGLGLWLLIRQRILPVGILATAVIPAGIWYIFVRNRYGFIPPLDPYLRETTDTVGAPGSALARSLTNPASIGSLLTTLAHVIAAGISTVLSRTSIFALVGAVAGLQLLSAAPFAWTFIGDATRISAFLQMMTVLALVGWRRPDWLLPAARAQATTSPGTESG